MKKQEILEEINNALGHPITGTNSMGRNESNYNPHYMVGSCFTPVELQEMTELELQALLKLAQYASDAFY